MTSRDSCFDIIGNRNQNYIKMKKKIIKWVIIVAVVGFATGGGVVFYLFNMPHRDVQAASADYYMNAKDLVSEYLKNPQDANEKYLQEEGESKIIVVTGTISDISEDMKHQKVVLLKDSGEKAGVSCTFMASTNDNAASLHAGQKTTLKGVIRSGAGYDEDLDMYEDVIMEKCDVVHASQKK